MRREFRSNSNSNSNNRNPRPRPAGFGGFRNDDFRDRDRERPRNPRPQPPPKPRKPAGPAQPPAKEPATAKLRRRMMKAAAWRLARLIHATPAKILAAPDPTELVNAHFPPQPRRRSRFSDGRGDAMRLAIKIVRLRSPGGEDAADDRPEPGNEKVIERPAPPPKAQAPKREVAPRDEDDE